MSETMLAARLHEGADRFALDEVAVPAIGPADCLVRVHACGICGSDLHVLSGITPTPFKPITLGHEPAGVVAAVGDVVEGFAPGARVFVNPLLCCGVCDACRRGRSHICAHRTVLGIQRDGALAEYVAVPAANLVALPDGLPFAEAAIIESASTPYHALTARAPVRPGDAVVVVGVGGIGIHCVQVARIAGASVIVAVDVDEVPLERARRLGATHVVDARGEDVVTAVRAITGGGADIAVECVGRSDTSGWALAALRPGGTALLLGINPEPIPLPPTTVFSRTELDVRGVYGYSQPEVERVAQLIDSGQLDARAAISETFPLEAVNEGLEHFREKTGFPVRVLITADDGA